MVGISKYEKEMIDRLESMPFEQARREIRTGAIAPIGSPAYDFALSWLLGKEAELRDARDEKTSSIARSALRIARQQKIIAITALIIAIIAIIISILLKI